jgi:hypothetical protein
MQTRLRITGEIFVSEQLQTGGTYQFLSVCPSRLLDQKLIHNPSKIRE